MKNLLLRGWKKIRLPLFIIILCLGCIGWTTAYWLWQPIKAEAEQVWQDYQTRQMNKGIGDSVKEETPKTESYVPADSAEVHRVASGGQVAQATAPSTSVEKLIRETWKNEEEAKIAIAVMLAESGGNPKAENYNSDGSKDCGLWQINSCHNPTKEQCEDPEENTKLAYKIYEKSGKTFKPWVAFTSKKYLKFL
jgi:hypothetical protein